MIEVTIFIQLGFWWIYINFDISSIVSIVQ